MSESDESFLSLNVSSLSLDPPTLIKERELALF